MVNGQYSLDGPEISWNDHGRGGQRQASEDDAVTKTEHVFVSQGTSTDGHEEDRRTHEYFENEKKERQQPQHLIQHIFNFHYRLRKSDYIKTLSLIYLFTLSHWLYGTSIC